MNIKALIKKYEAVECVVGIVSGKTILKTVLRDLEQLDEPQKVKVPQFVAEWIEEARKACKDVAELFEFDFTNDEVRKWFMQERPFDLVARAWLDGYEVEKEKRYFVSLNNGQPLTKTQSGKVLYFNQLPSLAEKAIKKEFSKNDPDFDIEKHFVEEVAIVNLSKFHSYFEDRV
ncbi:phage protein [Streptococcus pneumoniae]|nr:phage protein [Streptococcus pneumoniae]VRR26270.1 phage protein [Streptococcus pneumoniae]VRR62408.1 phage protein [Streptococcus pneumoniae]